MLRSSDSTVAPVGAGPLAPALPRAEPAPAGPGPQALATAPRPGDGLHRKAALRPAEPTPAGSSPASRAGSRRRKLWDLANHAHCPVVGVCLPIAALRQLVDRVLGGQTQAGDYELHCGVNAECKQRNRLSEAVNKALDHRYAQSLRQTQALKQTEALATWWQAQARLGHAVPGALWAVLSHPRCDAALEERVLQDIHMLQHQAGAADRADQARLQEVLHENQVLARELGAAQQRCTAQAQAQSRRIEGLQGELMRARADLIGRDTVIASLWDELRRLEASVPALRARHELQRQNARQMERIQDLERALLRSRHELEREQRQAEEARQALPAPAPAAPAGNIDTPSSPALDDTAEWLRERAVLCVGGRQASVPAYRQLVEQTGGRFLHHDGGDEDSVARLDHSLAAADLVICQTGCISHDAYWRVKDHCKRTGKRCLFVDKPSSASLKRALIRLAPADPTWPDPPSSDTTSSP